jgi:hypothetical protein
VGGRKVLKPYREKGEVIEVGELEEKRVMVEPVTK